MQTSVQLHVVQELLEVLQSESEVSDSTASTALDGDTVLMSISQQALTGTESSTSFRLRGWVQGLEVLMLVDSGSSHSFIDSTFAK